MSERDDAQDGLRERITARGEDAISEIADALLDNPLFKEAIGAAASASERAAQAQKAAMAAIGLSSSDETERLERRLRSFSDRLEQVEDQVDALARDVGALRRKLAAED